MQLNYFAQHCYVPTKLETEKRQRSYFQVSSNSFFLVHFAGDGMEVWEIAVLAAGAFLFGVLITGAAFVFYLRGIKKDNSLVTQDYLQSSFNTKVI